MAQHSKTLTLLGVCNEESNIPARRVDRQARESARVYWWWAWSAPTRQYGTWQLMSPFAIDSGLSSCFLFLSVQPSPPWQSWFLFSCVVCLYASTSLLCSSLPPLSDVALRPGTIHCQSLFPCPLFSLLPTLLRAVSHSPSSLTETSCAWYSSPFLCSWTQRPSHIVLTVIHSPSRQITTLPPLCA